MHSLCLYVLMSRYRADGVWLDGDGPDNGAYECSGSHNYNTLLPPYPALKTPAEIAKFCAGEALVTAAADEWLIANKGYNCAHTTYLQL
eukprot:SAG31_NODE_2423_length_5725_cov_29.530750_6_plen_89_part_00